MRIAESELIINGDGSVFHLHLRPEELADNVILVGDPGRVDMIAEYFDETGTLDFLLENYDLLHTLGKEQLLAEIERFLSKRGNK